MIWWKWLAETVKKEQSLYTRIFIEFHAHNLKLISKNFTYFPDKLLELLLLYKERVCGKISSLTIHPQNLFLPQNSTKKK